MELNIVELIEKNPIIQLSDTYQSKLLTKIKDAFNDDEQRLFVSSFYGYLNYNSKNDFAIDLDTIWEWIGFSQKVRAKELLEKQFILDIDYKCLLSVQIEQKKGAGRGGHNKEKIMLTVKTFKSFCLKAGTKKSGQIHEYYLKMEELLHDIVNEESRELKLQLESTYKHAQREKELIREKTILEQFPRNTQCIYYGLIDNNNDTTDQLVKFGNSNFLSDRVETHKKTYINFRLVNAFKVDNKTQIENAIKTHPFLSTLRCVVKINSVHHNEILSIQSITLEKLEELVKDIIVNIEYNPVNYMKILEENDKLKKENIHLTKQNALLTKYEIQGTIRPSQINELESADDEHVNRIYHPAVILLTEENKKLKIENIKLMKKYKITKQDYPEIIEPCNGVSTLTNVSTNYVVSDVEYNDITNSLKRIAKSADGLYRINGKVYKKCFGTRDEVWNETSFKTTGDLLKSDLLVNKLGKIVSKRKFISETQNNRLEAVNIGYKYAKQHRLECLATCDTGP